PPAHPAVSSARCFPSRRSSDLDADAVLRFESGGEEPPAVLQSRRRPDNGDGPRVEHLVDRLHLRRCPDLHANPPELTVLISASPDRKSTRLNSSHPTNSYAVLC